MVINIYNKVTWVEAQTLGVRLNVTGSGVTSFHRYCCNQCSSNCGHRLTFKGKFYRPQWSALNAKTRGWKASFARCAYARHIKGLKKKTLPMVEIESRTLSLYKLTSIRLRRSDMVEEVWILNFESSFMGEDFAISPYFFWYDRGFDFLEDRKA